MSIYQIDNKRRDIQKLKEQNAKFQSDIAKKHSSMIRCNVAIKRTKSETTIRSKFRELERYEKQIADLGKKIAANLKKESQYAKQLNGYIKRQDKEKDKAFDDALRKLDVQRHENHRVIIESVSESSDNGDVVEYDVFISHASEDKIEIADELAKLLRNKGVKVWYDKFVLSWGDSLSRKIGEGISNTKFGIVILSHNFFSKEWPQQELDALFNQELLGNKVILPIWHNISKNEVAKYSPLIAGKLALKTSDLTVDEISEKLLEMLDKT